MRSRHWFSIAALVTILLTFIFFPISDTAADGLSQTVQGTVGWLYCPLPPSPWWSQFTDTASRGIVPCFPIATSVTHTFWVTSGAELTVDSYHSPAGFDSFVRIWVQPAEACTLLSSETWGENYTCVAPDSGQLTVEAFGYGFYSITVTGIGIIEPPVDPPVVETPLAEPPVVATPDPEILAGVLRVNESSAIPYIVYVPTGERVANENTQFIDIWHLDANGVGQPLLYISREQLWALPALPAENLLIATSPDGMVNVYKLTTGEYQVNIGPLEDGKVYTTIFDGIPPTTVTHSTSVMQ